MRIFLAHGFRGHPGSPHWYAWLKEKLEEKGHRVFAPQFPTPEQPKLDEWIQTIERELQGDFHNVIFIGHSLGGCAVLRALEIHKERAKAVFLVGTPFISEGRPEPVKPFIDPPYDFKKLRQRCEKYYHIFSKDDPLINFQKEALAFKRFLGGEFISMVKMNHFDTQEKFPKILYLLGQILR